MTELSCLPGLIAELNLLSDECPSVPPSIAERYKVGRTLGDGTFAVVRECVERCTGREYALKIINKGKCRGKVRTTPVSAQLYRKLQSSKESQSSLFVGVSSEHITFANAYQAGCQSELVRPYLFRLVIEGSRHCQFALTWDLLSS